MTIPSSSGLLNYIGQIENGKNGKEKPTEREPAARFISSGCSNQLCLDRYQPSRRRFEHRVNVRQLLAWG
jgi:hypothetical protein